MRESQLQSATEAKADDAEFVEFVRAGERGTGAFECVACGYGAVHYGALPSCRSCGGALWERSAWAPFANVLSALGDRLH